MTCDNGPSDPDAHPPNQVPGTENARTRVSRFEGQPPRTRSRRSACHTRQRARERRGTAVRRCVVVAGVRRCVRLNTGSGTYDSVDGGRSLEAITHLNPDAQESIRTVIDGILMRHQARKLAI